MKIRLIEGTEVHYKFSGKPILFDPLEMLRDLNFRILESKNSALILSKSIVEIEDDQLISREKLNSTVSAGYEFKGKKVKIIRCVRTIGSMPCSRHEFFLNGNLISVFQRQYDYGKGFACTLERMESFGSLPQTKNSNSYYWLDGTSRQAIFLEKFGHTQIWVINDADGLDEIWKNLPNRSLKN
ncbi:MAG: hypothetical protein PSV36_10675 [Algoriphagus sp.]|nr:hypothetical protein [Algoriphagus sp.]